MTVCFDTNILVSAFAEDDPRHDEAFAVITSLMGQDLPLPDQVLREFLAVSHRKRIISIARAREVATLLTRRFALVAGQVDDLQAASVMVERHRFQFYDALLCCTALRAGSTTLFSQDMQDGFDFAGLKIVDPFAASNADLVADLLA